MRGTRALPSSARSLSKAFMRISAVTLFRFPYPTAFFRHPLLHTIPAGPLILHGVFLGVGETESVPPNNEAARALRFLCEYHSTGRSRHGHTREARPALPFFPFLLSSRLSPAGRVVPGRRRSSTTAALDLSNSPHPPPRRAAPCRAIGRGHGCFHGTQGNTRRRGSCRASVTNRYG